MKSYRFPPRQAMPLLLGYLTLLAFFAADANAQHFRIGTDLVSRYVWRGTDFGESASLQPSLTAEWRAVELGSWASYSISSDGAEANEHDTWVAISLPATALGSITLGVTDYYFPSPGGADFFDYAGDGNGSHLIEPFLRYVGPDSAPLTLFAAVIAHNDPDGAAYVEADMPIQVDEVTLTLTAGSVLNESSVYGTSGFAVVNLALAATKDLRVSSGFSVPVTVSYVLNPHQERSFLVIGFSIVV